MLDLLYCPHMPEGEPQPHIPEWAQRERITDLAWIVENLHIFWPVARSAFDEFGRGAMVVDTTSRPTEQGHPFGYFPQEQIETYGGEDEIRMVAAYDPEREMVTILLKPRDRWSTYRIGVPGARQGR